MSRKTEKRERERNENNKSISIVSRTVARLLLDVGLVAGLAEASAALQVPVAVAFAQVFGRRVLDGVGHADAVRLLDGGQLAAGGRGRERGERGRHLGTRDVVDSDGQERDAGALVAERKVHTFLRHRDGAHLRVDDHLSRAIQIENNVTFLFVPCPFFLSFKI